MKNKFFKIVSPIILLIGIVFWLNNTLSFFEVEQKNDRIAISNAVVDIVNDMQSKAQAPQALFEQFLRLDEFDQSKQRGTWALLDLMEFDYQKDIDEASSNLAGVFSNKQEQDKILLLPAQKLLQSYSGYDAIYKEISRKIKSKSLSNEQLQSLLAQRYQQLALMSEEAMNEFQAAQYSYIKGQ